MMAFDNLAAFLQMGGYWPYVWSAYGLTLLVLAGNLLLPLLERRRLLAEAARRAADARRP